MDKIKSVISGHRKSTDAPNEPTPPLSKQQPEKNVSSDIPHPIYDQFTSNQQRTEQNQALGTSLLRPDAAKGHESAQSEAVSTASVKSGVIGYPPQAQSSHVGNVHGVQQNVGDDATLTLGNEHHSSTGTGISGDRAFPLAGGVAHSRPAGSTTTSERKPGTKDKSSGVRDGDGKEALAGAATAAMSSHGRSQAYDSKGPETQKYHPDALAAAVAADANTHPPATHIPQDTQQGERHIAICGSPEAFVDASHRPSPLTHVSELRERRLHIPGEFPSPTPIIQSSAPSYFQSKDAPTTNTTDQHELRHTGSFENLQMSSGDDHEKPGHHYGKDAAIAGGLGAAGAAAYAGMKHGGDGATQISGEVFLSEPDPYSSKKIDPRVDVVPVSSYDQQKFDPTTPTKHQGRDAFLAGGGSSHTSSNQPTFQPNKDRPQQQQGRDAALVSAGAGAATTASLYARQRANEPDSGPASSTIGPHESNIANVLDPRVQPDPSLQKHHHAAPTVDDPAPSTMGPHKSDAANILDPRVLPDPQKQKAQPKGATHGGNTTIASDEAEDAVRLYDTHRATQPAASMNDQRYDPLAPGAHNPSQGTLNSQASEKKDQHHPGHDAAIVASLGAAGASMYATSRGNDSSQQPTAAQQQFAHPQRIQQGVRGQLQHPNKAYQQPHDTQYNNARSAAIVGGVSASGIGAYAGRDGYENTTSQNYDPLRPNQQFYPAQPQQVSDETVQQPQHHYGRDAAVLGGLGAAGAGAYAATRDDRHTQNKESLQQQPSQPGLQPSIDLSSQQHQRYDSVQGPNAQDHHQKRDAAAGTAGALAGAGGAYAYSQHDAEKERKAAEKAHEQLLKEQQSEFEKEQKKAQKAQEKALHDKQKELEHQHAKEQKHHNKLVAAEEKKHHNKLVAAEEKKHHNKLVAAEEKKHHKELEKEKREQQSESEKALPEDEGDKKKHHLLGFLHRNKDKRRSIDEKNTRRSVESPRHSTEHTGTGHGTPGSQHSSDDEKKTRNKLHKEPPPGHPAREATEHQQHEDQDQSPITKKRHFFGTKRMSGSDHHSGADRPISSGIYSADDAAWHHESAAEPQAQHSPSAGMYGSGTV